MALKDLNILLKQLNISDTAKGDKTLYQIIKELIASLRELQGIVGTISSGGSGSTTTNIEQIYNMYSMMEEAPVGEMGPPGINGQNGINASTIIIMMEDHNEETYFFAP